jgi:predicted metal-binding membrane protein
VCRTPAAYLVRHYRRGAPAGFALGWDHGLFCLGCCWALMLVMFAVGVSDVWWMAILAALMAYENVGRRGPQVAAVAGVAFLVLATVVPMHPPWAAGGPAGRLSRWAGPPYR